MLHAKSSFWLIWTNWIFLKKEHPYLRAAKVDFWHARPPTVSFPQNGIFYAYFLVITNFQWIFDCGDWITVIYNCTWNTTTANLLLAVSLNYPNWQTIQLQHGVQRICCSYDRAITYIIIKLPRIWSCWKTVRTLFIMQWNFLAIPKWCFTKWDWSKWVDLWLWKW